MQLFATTHETPSRRVRWVYDEDYTPFGNYALDTEEETRQAEQDELAALEAGTLVALGAIVETKCPTCGQWETKYSLWGIIVDPSDDLTAIGEDCLDIPDAAPVAAV